MSAPQSLPTPNVDALDLMERTVAGNQGLIMHPNVAAAMAQAGATVQQSGVVSQYLDGLRVKQMVDLHRSSGMTDPIPLSGSQVQAANALGVDLSGVYETPEQLLAKQSADITARGNVPIVENGQVVGERPKTAQETQAHHDSSILHSIFHNDVTNVIGRGFHDVLSGFTAAGNIANSVLGTVADDVQHPTHFNPEGFLSASSTDAANQDEIRTLGYDPNSALSMMAMRAKGLYLPDLSNHVQQHGADTVNAAVEYMKSPKDYMSTLVQKYQGDPVALQKAVAQAGSPEFQSLIKEINGNRPTLGNLMARGALEIQNSGISGYDPATDPRFASHAAAYDFAVMVASDPTLAAGKAVTAARTAQAGIDSLGDVSRFAQVMREGKGMYAVRAQTQLQNAVDNANLVRKAETAYKAAQDSGDAAAIASTKADWLSANARFDAGSAAYAPIKDQLMGRNLYLKSVEEKDAAGAYKGVNRIVTDGEPLDTYDKALNYLVERRQLAELAYGKAARELPYAPGALSSWTVTRMRQAWAGQRAAKDAVIDMAKPGAADRVLASGNDAQELWSGMTLAAKTSAESAADRVIKLQSSLNDLEKQIADGAGHAAGVVASAPGAALDSASRAAVLSAQRDRIAAQLDAAQKEAGTAQQGLASAERAARDAALQAGKINEAAATGDAAFAARGGGKGILGALLPSESWERMRLAAQRLKMTKLPAHNKLDIRLQADGTAIYQYAKTYLPATQAQEIRAMWDAGDRGIRRNLIRSTNLQIAHAAGLPSTAKGRALMDEMFTNEPELYAANQRATLPFDPLTGKQDASFAVFPGQVETQYRIFDFKQLHQAAAKIGLIESTIGRALTSKFTDGIFNVLRYGMLAAPRTVPRNTVDTRLMMASRGLTNEMVTAKAWLRDNGGIADRHWLARLGMENAFTGAIGRAYRNVLKDGAPGDLKFLDEVNKYAPHDMQLAQAALSVGRRSDINVDDRAAELSQLLEDGFTPAAMKFKMANDFEQKGWESFQPFGVDGANKWSDSLGRAMWRTPEVTKAVVRYLEAGATTRVKAFQDVLDSMRSPEAQQWFKDMEFSHIVTDANGIPKVAVTSADAKVAAEQHAWRMIETMHDMLTDSTGKYIQPVADVLKTGVTPDAEWIGKNLPKLEQRPKSVIGPKWVAKVVDNPDATAQSIQKIGEGLQDVTGKFYQRVVEDQIASTVVLPSYWAFYIKARKAAEPTREALVHEGLSDEAAWHVVHHQSMLEARHRLTDYIDDPSLRSQFDIVGRNFVMFPRASFQFIDRLWKMAKYDPTAIRKAALTLNLGEHSGVVYRDQNGDLSYTFPGSEMTTDAIQNIMHVLGVNDGVTLPITGALSGKVTQSVPGYDNPFRMSLSPMVNIPFRYTAHFFPSEASTFTELDHIFNGQGAGQSSLSTALPGPVKRLWDAMTPEDRDGMKASAVRDALLSLYAADPDGSKGIFPVGAQPGSDELVKFTDRVKQQVKNQMFVRAFSSFFMPSTPSRPADQAKNGGTNADAAYKAAGIRSLDQEFKAILNSVGGSWSQATAVWAALHPDKMIYTQSTTKSLVPGVSLAATKSFQSWVQNHLGFIKKYPDTWAYFAPNLPGPFDSNAFKAQLNLGIRQHLTPAEFIDTYQKQQQVDGFFAKDDAKKAELAAAMRTGDMLHVAQIQRQYRDDSNAYLAANPLVLSALNPSPQDMEKATNSLANLRTILADPTSPVQNREGLRQLVQLYDDLSRTLATAGGAGTTARSSVAKDQASQRMAQIVQANPDLKGVYNGVFRKLGIGLKSLASQLGQ